MNLISAMWPNLRTEVWYTPIKISVYTQVKLVCIISKIGVYRK